MDKGFKFTFFKRYVNILQLYDKMFNSSNYRSVNLN